MKNMISRDLLYTGTYSLLISWSLPQPKNLEIPVEIYQNYPELNRIFEGGQIKYLKTSIP